jgi:hypothetical protein
MKIALFVAFAVLLSCAVASLALAQEGGEEGVKGLPTNGNQVLCVCRCCFHSQCSQIANSSWLLDDCSTCTAQRCRDNVMATSTRERIGRTFRILGELQDAEAAAAATGSIDPDRKIMVQHTLETLRESKWNVCEVTAMVEAVTCKASGTAGECQTAADLSAVCYDRHASTVKVGTIAFLTVVVVGVLFAVLGKNHLNGFVSINQASFDY